MKKLAAILAAAALFASCTKKNLDQPAPSVQPITFYIDVQAENTDGTTNQCDPIIVTLKD